MIVLDSMEEGRHGGAFCQRRAEWLDKTLSDDPDRPTLIALHHPPIETGIGWMTAHDDDEWVMRLNEVVSRYDNIVQIICGHIHRVMFKAFAGTNVSVAKAIAPQVKLELAEIDPEKPDDRILIIDSLSGYSLCHWRHGNLTTHHATAPNGRPIIRYDDKHAYVIKKTLDLPES